MNRLVRQIKLFVYYCSPCLVALAVVITAYSYRVRDVQDAVVRQVCQQLDRTSDAPPLETDIPAQLQKIIKIIKGNGWTTCQQNTSSVSTNLTVPEYIQSHFRTAWRVNSVVIAVLTLLPFAILAAGLTWKYRSQLTTRVKVDGKQHYLNYRAIAHKDFALKFLVGFVIAVGWLYIFNPHGQAASAINDWLRRTDIIASDTAPNFFNFKDSSLKHALAAMFGWYLYLLGYFSYRFYKSDVLGTRVYNVLFKKFLFVIGVAFIISSVGANSNESLLIVFLIGFFPLSALTLLTEFGSKKLSVGEDQTSLSVLPGISTWQILRLEEEGVDSLSSLANSDPATLNRVISSEVIGHEILETWIDQARLIAVVGTKRWTDLNGICERASEFVKKESIKDPGFIAKLAEKNVFNADEISNTVQKNFKIVRPQ
jgi:hypothetical protein